MTQHGLLFKPLRNGFLLLYNTSVAGKERSKEDLLRENIRLVFDVLLKDTLFYNYTEVDVGTVASHFFFFNNEQQRVSAENLHSDLFVAAEDLRPVSALPRKFFVKPFGQLELLLDDKLLSSYYISFQAKATRWCYFLMSDDLRTLAHPAVIGNNGNGYFNIPVTVTLPDNVKVPVIMSRSPLPLGNTGAHSFQLVDYAAAGTDRYKVVIPSLPAPDISRVSNAGAALYERGNSYSEIFLY